VGGLRCSHLLRQWVSGVLPAFAAGLASLLFPRGSGIATFARTQGGQVRAATRSFGFVGKLKGGGADRRTRCTGGEEGVTTAAAAEGSDYAGRRGDRGNSVAMPHATVAVERGVR